jgi:hypothetical protein
MRRKVLIFPLMDSICFLMEYNGRFDRRKASDARNRQSARQRIFAAFPPSRRRGAPDEVRDRTILTYLHPEPRTLGQARHRPTLNPNRRERALPPERSPPVCADWRSGCVRCRAPPPQTQEGRATPAARPSACLQPPRQHSGPARPLQPPLRKNDRTCVR